MDINILIVDDLKENLFSLKQMIQEVEFDQDININILEATSGEEALEIAFGNKLALILLDVQMPGMDGFETAKFLKSSSKTKDVPVIFVTAIFKAQEYINKGFALGGMDYFVKPIEIVSLSAKLRLYISLYVKNIELENQAKKLQEEKKLAQELQKQAQEASESKSSFLANMSHEIRTPLNAIMGFLPPIKKESQGRAISKYIDVIESSSHSLLQIINDILDFSKIESGKLDIDKIDFNPTHEFSITTELFKARLDEKGIKLNTNFSNLPNSLNGDILRIKQVINNLLSNSIKFTEKDKNIYFDASYSDGYLNLSVKDEGIGISQKYQETIFDAFSQEDSSTTRKYGGTGLGLAISYNLIKAMDSELKVKSELGNGSDFYCSIPMEVGQSLEEDSYKDDIQESFDAHILLVEDNIANQMVMEVILEELGITFEIANHGQEAVDMFTKSIDEKKYDCILMDENMPVMDGITASKNILELESNHPSVKHTPIVALTANALKGDRERFLDAGMDEYLSKPIDINELKTVLTKVL